MSEYKVTELEQQQRTVTTNAKQAYNILMTADREAEQLLDAINQKRSTMQLLVKRLITTVVVVGIIMALLLWISNNI